MVLYDGTKFACLSCIRGHRSSNCNHVERPLLEVRKKGRPVSQCGYCRDLRKTRQIHAKCACIKNKGSSITTTVSSPPQSSSAQQECSTDSACFSSYYDALCQEPPTAAVATAALQEHQQQHQECTCIEKAKVVLYSSSPQPHPLPSLDESCFSHKKRCSSTNRLTKKRRSNVPSDDGALATLSDSLSLPLSDQHEQHEQHQHQQKQEQEQQRHEQQQQQQGQEQQQQQQQPSLAFIGDGLDPLTLLLFPPPQEQQQQQQAPTTAATAAAAAATEELMLDGLFQQQFSPYYQQSFCGSLIPHPACLPQNPDAQGESVMVTVTPLSTSSSLSGTRSRIVTCYCGYSCVCPGCLVHPHQQDLLVGSSSSSCCNGSSDDE